MRSFLFVTSVFSACLFFGAFLPILLAVFFVAYSMQFLGLDMVDSPIIFLGFGSFALLFAILWFTVFFVWVDSKLNG